ncbi:MAG: hypothetical protein IJR85_04705 [Synergistaceae bacterium]|nr:hypothetical protein [Synergistaceae bacterium]
MNFQGWDFRSIYEQPPPDLMEAEAFFAAFAKFHDIDGTSIECIFTRAKRQPVAIIPGANGENIDGITSFTSVLIVKDEDISGAEQGGSLRIDGVHCRIMTVSHPIMGITRMELEGYAG